MNKRTFEIIARYISDEYGIKVTYSDSVAGPCIELNSKTIKLPSKIKEENAFAALSSLMHEAAHMKHSTVIPQDFSKTDIDHHIVNAIEDVRIDKRNFQVLPNVFSFYEIFVRDHIATPEYQKKLLATDLFTRCMVYCILVCEYFTRYAMWDRVAIDYSNKHNLTPLFMEGIDAINDQDWKKLREIVDKIKAAFPGLKEKPKGKEGSVHGSTTGEKGKAKASQGDGEQSGEDPNGQGNAGSNNGADQSPSELMRPSSVWGKGGGLTGAGESDFHPTELEEQTKNRFKNALNIAERIKTDEQKQLSTDKLTSFFSGDVEELFHEEDEEKVKKSKIIFCLDSSGSMGSYLLDHTRRKDTLAGCVQSLITILDDVREEDSLNVDYDVMAFDDDCHWLDKDTWSKDYYCNGGGTELLKASTECLQRLDSPELDGNRIFILLTDGMVSTQELEQCREEIQKRNGEVKALVIGIGADACNEHFFHGNILCKDHADQVLMEAIQMALGVQ